MTASSSEPQVGPELNPQALRHAALRRVNRMLTARADLSLPAAPALLDHYTEILSVHFAALGRPFNGTELAHLRELLGEKLAEAFRISPHSRVKVTYTTDPYPATTLTYNVAVEASTMEREYKHWVDTREPPLFGAHPDHRVVEGAESLGDPATVRVLDLGAGTGRNAFPLAARGHRVDAVEVSPDLVKVLEQTALQRAPELGQRVRILHRDVFDGDLPITKGDYRLVVASELATHFRSAGQLRLLFTLASEALAPGGLLLVNAFVALRGLNPDSVMAEVSELAWSRAFTEEDLGAALQGLPLAGVGQDWTYAYERARTQDANWPPTGWFDAWSLGLDVFDVAPSRTPLPLQWLALRRT